LLNFIISCFCFGNGGAYFLRGYFELLHGVTQPGAGGVVALLNLSASASAVAISSFNFAICSIMIILK
jgi:hypothetical protein